MKTNPKNNGFTLVELLVVIAVIGILAGLMVPLVQGMRKRALLSDAKDLCIQVADAWEALAIDQGRFPQTALIEEEAKKAPCAWSKTYKGDLVIAMNPAVGNLLNFWRPVSPLPQTDPDTYKKNAKKNNLKTAKVAWSGGEAPSVAETEKWAADTRFERSVSQKRFGVFPMGSQCDHPELTEDGTCKICGMKNADDATTPRPAGDTHLVVVMLDTDGDGVVHPDKAWLPGSSASGGDDSKTPAVRRRAVAWCAVARADDEIVYSWK